MTAIALQGQRSFLDNLAIVLHRAAVAYAKHRRQQAKRAQIARELYSCSDRDLKELNIDSADIPAIINGTYRR